MVTVYTRHVVGQAVFDIWSKIDVPSRRSNRLTLQDTSKPTSATTNYADVANDFTDLYLT